ncbi:hypothetical protein SFRURICE_017870 [Spodoptera frugiperda]|nr:hypothetical protein SFRURICE_017870 [Spodoptera frugiperda]
MVLGTMTMSLLYVEQKKNKSAFDALIGWIIRAGQSKRRRSSRFDYFKSKTHTKDTAVLLSFVTYLYQIAYLGTFERKRGL